jgi:hypothetical protein
VLLLGTLSFAVAAVTLLISRAQITQWIRDAVPFIVRRGLECPFCVSLWISCMFVGWYGPLPNTSLFLSVLAVWGGAAATIGIAAQGDD